MRQLVSVLVVAGACLSGLGYWWITSDRPITDAERDRWFDELEAEHGLSPWSRDGDFDAREERLDAQMDRNLVASKLRVYQSVLDAVGYVEDPSPEQEAFLEEHRSELRNLVIRRSNTIDVSLGYRLHGMSLESCRPNGRMLRCTVKTARGQWYEGWALAATASRFDGRRVVDLPGTAVFAPSHVSGVAEIDLLVPAGADSVRLSYQGSNYSLPPRPALDSLREPSVQERSDRAESSSSELADVVAPRQSRSLPTALVPDVELPTTSESPAHAPAVEPTTSSSPAESPGKTLLRVGHDIQAPTKTKHVVPVYPPIAQNARISGIVIIEATINEQGEVQAARVIRSVPLLDHAALDAVRQWEFTPTLLNGKPTPIIMSVTLTFSLGEKLPSQ